MACCVACEESEALLPAPGGVVEDVDRLYAQLCESLPLPLRQGLTVLVDNPLVRFELDLIALGSAGLLGAANAIATGPIVALGEDCPPLSESVAAEFCRASCILGAMTRGEGVLGEVLSAIDLAVPLVGSGIRGLASVVIGLSSPVCAGRLPTAAELTKAADGLGRMQTVAAGIDAVGPAVVEQRAASVGQELAGRFGDLTLIADELCSRGAADVPDRCAGLTGAVLSACRQADLSGRGTETYQQREGGGGVALAGLAALLLLLR